MVAQVHELIRLRRDKRRGSLYRALTNMTAKENRSGSNAPQRSRQPDDETSEPNVGILFLVGRSTLFVHSTPVPDASSYGGFTIEEKDHLQYWEDLLRAGLVPAIQYDETPRGRCVLDRRTKTFTLLLDKCILQRKDLVAEIVKRLHLPITSLVLSEDAHYRCPRCLRVSEIFPNYEKSCGTRPKFAGQR